MFPIIHTRTRPVWADPIASLQREFDSLLGQRCSTDAGNTREWFAHYPVDIHETQDSIIVEAELPGFKKDEVDVTIENGVLTLNAARKSVEKPQGAEEHITERRYTRVQRGFTLPTTVDETGIDARLNDGVLTITLKKREEVKPKRIKVS